MVVGAAAKVNSAIYWNFGAFSDSKLFAQLQRVEFDMPHRFLASVLPQHEAAELYRLMVVGIRDVAVFLMDPKGYITVWNRGAQDMKGYTADDALGQHLGMLYTDEDRASGRPEHNLQMAEQHGFFSEEQWRKRKDGGLFWAHIALTALRGEKEELLGFSKVTMDLTRHKLLEQCAKEKEEIDLILRAAESGTWKWELETDDVEVSSYLMQLLGHDAPSHKLPFDAWLEFIHEDDRAPFRARLEQVRDHPESAPVETEIRFHHKEGDFEWFFLRANWHLVKQDAPLVFMGVCVAVGSLKTAEEEQARLLAALRHERARFASVLDQMPSGVVLAEIPGGRVIYQNEAVRRLMGQDMRDVDSVDQYGRFKLFDLAGQVVPGDALPLARTVLTQQVASVQDLLYQRDDGAKLHLAITSAAVSDADGQAHIAVAVVHDISKLRQAEQAATSEQERALVTLAAITDGVVTVNRDGAVIALNPTAERLLGMDEAVARDKPLHDLLHFDEPDGANAIGAAVERCVQEQQVISRLPHLTMSNPHGHHFSIETTVSPVKLGDGALLGAVVVLHDVTESKRLLRRLGFEASHDALTGLVNRREFETRLARTIDRNRQPGSDNAALLYMDLDQFKIVNDTCGHAAGDDLLKLLAASYTEHVRERDTLARIGGDEFALIVEHCEVQEALAVAHKILEATRNFRYACNGQMFQLGVSIGLTPIDSATTSVEDALRRADHACYIAKERGRNRVHVHYQGDLDLAQRRSDMHWVTRLTHAFQHDQLQLYYQPIVALDDGETTQHYEILLRLRNGSGTPILPGIFLPAAERYDVILKIDRWVLDSTLAWLAAHPDHLEQLGTCSINLSRRSLADPSFHKFAADLIDSSSVPARKLCFEITEHGAIADMQKTITFIEALSARGCRFSLDDFGTGMTSFSYLKQLPVNFIKIDGSFVQMMSSSPVDYEMVRFTNDISHMMGRKTIAEYVSDPHILARLREIGVDFAQGNCIGKPRPLAM
ncbi:PAS domain S-box-containing protein/diguanylate cyclase (GGDEF) domain-containing protein [Massilia sp. CF038]|nr:PAS domain S-box-containing protein/diguanylate cyclase (GGDEF) domain-containing protein [Massilia sp. CF038]